MAEMGLMVGAETVKIIGWKEENIEWNFLCNHCKYWVGKKVDDFQWNFWNRFGIIFWIKERDE